MCWRAAQRSRVGTLNERAASQHHTPLVLSPSVVAVRAVVGVVFVPRAGRCVADAQRLAAVEASSVVTFEVERTAPDARLATHGGASAAAAVVVGRRQLIVLVYCAIEQCFDVRTRAAERWANGAH